MFANSRKDSVLRETFNCPLKERDDFQIAAELDEVPEFEETDVETSESDSSCLEATDSEKEIFLQQMRRHLPHHHVDLTPVAGRKISNFLARLSAAELAPGCWASGRLPCSV